MGVLLSTVVDKKIQAIEILLSDSRGIYIPRDFIKCYDLTRWGFKGQITKIKKSLSNPENENYWDTWDFVLNNARFYHNGNSWLLYHDGDLFAVCDELMTDTEFYNFYGEERDSNI